MFDVASQFTDNSWRNSKQKFTEFYDIINDFEKDFSLSPMLISLGLNLLFHVASLELHFYLLISRIGQPIISS